MSIILIKNLHHSFFSKMANVYSKNICVSPFFKKFSGFSPYFKILFSHLFASILMVPPDPPGFFSHHPPCPPWNRLQRSVWPKDLVVSHGVQRLRGHPLQHPLRLRSSGDRERVKITRSSLGLMIDSYVCIYIYIYIYIYTPYIYIYIII